MSEPVLSVTARAAQKILELQQEKELTGMAVRVTVHDLAGSRYSLKFSELSDADPGDQRIESEGITLFIDERSADKLGGATLDFIEELSRSGFKLDNPNAPELDPLTANVQNLIDERVTPALAQHGGTVTLLDVKDGRVFLEFGGGCQGCGMVDVTLKQGIVSMLKEEIPEINEVLDTTDHAAGTNPYFQPQS